MHNKLFFSIVLAFLFQSLILCLINISYFSKEAFKILPAEDIGLLVGIFSITYALISIYLLRQIFNLVEKDTADNNREAYLEGLKESLRILRSQRHDFLNHLQVVHGFLQIGLVKDAQEYLAALCQEAKQPGRQVTIDQPALAALLEAKKEKAEGQGVTFQVEVQSDLRHLYLAPLETTSLFGNLLDNALEATGRAGHERRVWLRAYEKNGEYVFEIGNTGPVIPQDLRQKIFERGFTTKEDKEGHGEGLAIVKEIVGRHKGTIAVDSGEAGTVFTLRLPKERAV
ncbi:MAG: hypothetical protein PWP65_1919 [Clostridia bacterium]|nr:hypothetical protein [Clostridia bacterium]